MPFFVLCFGATAAAAVSLIVTARIPVVNLIPYFVAAPLWPILTLNAGFASIVVEALIGRINVYWLVLPCLWFGGYTGAAYESHRQAAALNSDVQARNDLRRVDFSPQAQALVFEGGGLTSADRYFVLNYRLPVAYTRERDHRNKARYRAVRILPDPYCWAKSSGYSSSGVIDYSNPSSRMLRLVQGMCVAIFGDKKPALPEVLVSEKWSSPDDRGVPYKLAEITIQDTQGHSTRFVTGTADVLPWLPLPAMMCDLNSSELKCWAEFMRTTTPLGVLGDQKSATLELIAAKLGLQKSYADERRAEIEAAKPNL